MDICVTDSRVSCFYQDMTWREDMSCGLEIIAGAFRREVICLERVLTLLCFFP